MRSILLATRNPGKLSEMLAICDAWAADHPNRVAWIRPADLRGLPPDPLETGHTFLDNALLKAAHYSRASGHWAIADDSGLEVEVLDGEPGVRSARWAGLGASSPRSQADAANNRKLIERLAGLDPATWQARFRCVMVLASAEQVLATAEGVVHGRIIASPRGTGGFGYDPHFLIEELGRTTAELAPDEKNRISHRGRALRSLLERLAALVPGPADV